MANSKQEIVLEKVKRLRWKPKRTSREAIELTAKALAEEVFFR